MIMMPVSSVTYSLTVLSSVFVTLNFAPANGSFVLASIFCISKTGRFLFVNTTCFVFPHSNSTSLCCSSNKYPSGAAISSMVYIFASKFSMSILPFSSVTYSDVVLPSVSVTLNFPPAKGSFVASSTFKISSFGFALFSNTSVLVFPHSKAMSLCCSSNKYPSGAFTSVTVYTASSKS